MPFRGSKVKIIGWSQLGIFKVKKSRWPRQAVFLQIETIFGLDPRNRGSRVLRTDPGSQGTVWEKWPQELAKSSKKVLVKSWDNNPWCGKIIIMDNDINIYNSNKIICFSANENNSVLIIENINAKNTSNNNNHDNNANKITIINNE